VFLVEQNVHQTLAISHYGYVLSKGAWWRRGGRTNWRAGRRSAKPISGSGPHSVA
jgi:ABC-type branched-chain amino acid transport systems, ATPase component